MKRMIAGFITVMLLLCPFCSLAEESVPSPTVTDVFSRFLGRDIDPGSIVLPTEPEYDLKMLHLTASGAFLDHRSDAESILCIVFKAESKDPGCLPVFLEQEHEDRIEYNGDDITLEQFRGDKDLISCELVSGEIGAWYDYSDEGLFLFSFIVNPNMTALKDSSEVSLFYWCENLQTGEKDNGTITVNLPPVID